MCDKLDSDQIIMNSWKDRIKRKYKQLYNPSSNSNNIIHNALISNEIDTNLNNYKVTLDKTYTLLDNYPTNFIGTVYIAAFSVNNILVRPFLEYLLIKNPPDHKNPNELYFPFFDCFQDTDIEEESNLIIKQIFSKSKNIIDYLGYCLIDNSCYLIYDTGSRKYNPKEKSLNSYWWWTTIFEVIETGNIFDFKINQSVKKLFLYEPGLCRLVTSREKRVLENPIIAYQYENNDDLQKNLLFGLTRQQIRDKGLFIISCQFHRAKQLASLALSNPFINIQNEPNYIDYQSDYSIMRVAIFKGNSTLITKEQFESDNSEYHNLFSKNFHTLMIDYNQTNCENNDIIFLLKEDSRCYFINFIKLSSYNLFSLEHQPFNINFLQQDTNNQLEPDNLSENSDIVLVNH